MRPTAAANQVILSALSLFHELGDKNHQCDAADSAIDRIRKATRISVPLSLSTYATFPDAQVDSPLALVDQLIKLQGFEENAMVASKTLHFIFPHAFPIIDTTVIKRLFLAPRRRQIFEWLESRNNHPWILPTKWTGIITKTHGGTAIDYIVYWQNCVGMLKAANPKELYAARMFLSKEFSAATGFEVSQLDLLDGCLVE